jgi:hypothetical protein
VWAFIFLQRAAASQNCGNQSRVERSNNTAHGHKGDFDTVPPQKSKNPHYVGIESSNRIWPLAVTGLPGDLSVLPIRMIRIIIR